MLELNAKVAAVLPNDEVLLLLHKGQAFVGYTTLEWNWLPDVSVGDWVKISIGDLAV